MIEEQLLNYGVLGLWTISLILKEIKFNNRMAKSLDANTAILKKIEKKLC